MKKLKKIIAIVLSVCLLAAVGAMFIGCSDKADFHVGIVQLVTHDALDAATKGFMDALSDEMAKAGKTVKFDLQNAAGDSPTCVPIANNFVAKKYDLIMANATPALQAAANSTTSIPVLGTSITEYGVALNIENFSGTVGTNISGTSDLANLADQAQMILDFFPNVKKVGLLYCSTEANSLYQVETVKKYLEAKGVTGTFYTFTDSNDISAVVNSMVAAEEVIYIPTDNTAASNAETIDSICRAAKKPVIAGEEGICKGCGIATLSISYYGIGVKTGKMAAEILLNNADISKMAIAYDENQVYKYNETICKDLGIEIPTNHTYEKIAGTEVAE